jgi:hypothetical protein
VENWGIIFFWNIFSPNKKRARKFSGSFFLGLPSFLCFSSQKNSSLLFPKNSTKISPSKNFIFKKWH